MQPFRSRDRLWLLALPVYLLLLIVRHEGSHAVSAIMIDDAEVTSYSILPRLSDGHLVRPHIRVSGRISWISRFAPYAGDALLFLICLPICSRATRLPTWVWLNVAIIGVVSPLLDTGANYAVGLVRSGSDVGHLLVDLPPPAVHAYFLAALCLYGAGARALYRRAAAIGATP